MLVRLGTVAVVLTSLCWGCVLQIGDIKGLLDNRTQGASLYGASDFEKKTVIAGKLAHYGEHRRKPSNRLYKHRLLWHCSSIVLPASSLVRSVPLLQLP